MDINCEQLWHQAMSFSLLNVLQGPWAVIYVKNRVPRGTLGARETMNHEL
jgi:hypothetical protein